MYKEKRAPRVNKNPNSRPRSAYLEHLAKNQLI